MARSDKPKNLLTDKEYEKIGRIVHAVGETGYISKFRLYKLSLVKGIFAGLGSVIGATIVVSLLLWFFSVIGGVPLIGPVVETVQDNINSK